jgi:glycosyltransferase involved in cell wall biosynthesis
MVTAFRLAGWRQKGLPELIEAVNALDRDDICLTICGTGEPPPELLRLVADSSWCTLCADVADRELAGHLGRADLFILATRTRSGHGACGEGFGLVLLEAQIAGTPVVAPAYGGCADAYVQGFTGVSPTDETAGQLSRVLGSLLQDRVRLAWMGERAAEWARETFEPGRYAQLVSRQLL